MQMEILFKSNWDPHLRGIIDSTSQESTLPSPSRKLPKYIPMIHNTYISESQTCIIYIYTHI